MQTTRKRISRYETHRNVEQRVTAEFVKFARIEYELQKRLERLADQQIARLLSDPPPYYTAKQQHRCPVCCAYITVNSNGLLRKHGKCPGGSVMVHDVKQAKEKEASEVDAVVGLCML